MTDVKQDDNNCPHGVEKRKWTFDPYTVQRSREARYAVILNADGCPECLRERVRQLRKAFEMLLRACPHRVLEPEAKRLLEEAVTIYYADLSEHM